MFSFLSSCLSNLCSGICMDRRWKEQHRAYLVPFLSFRNYHFLWYNFLDNEKKNLTLFCFHYNNCSDPRNFKVAPKSESNVINILENPTEGVVIEETVTKPPCNNPDIVKTYSIEPICSLHQNLIINKESFQLIKSLWGIFK